MEPCLASLTLSKSIKILSAFVVLLTILMFIYVFMDQSSFDKPFIPLEFESEYESDTNIQMEPIKLTFIENTNKNVIINEHNPDIINVNSNHIEIATKEKLLSKTTTWKRKKQHRQNPKEKYSSFVCIGGDVDRKINNYKKTYGYFLQHSCHFKHICYSNKQSKWLYYAPPINESMSEMIQSNNYHIHYDFNTSIHGFLIMHGLRTSAFKPTIVNNAFPKSSNIDIMFDNKTVVYHYLQWVYNFGHVLTDNFYSMYRALQYFHLYTNNTCCQPLFDMTWVGAGFDDIGAKIPMKFINYLQSYLFNETKPLFLGMDSRKIRYTNKDLMSLGYNPIFVDRPDSDLMCFKDIVIGTDDFRVWWKAINRKFHHRWDWSNFIDIFRKHPLHIDRYNEFMKKDKQKILFISKGKHERRTWTNDTNVTYIAEYLETMFDVEVDSMEANDIYLSRNLQEQIDFILPYTLVITSCGAVSYIGAFMREGTAMITVDYWMKRHSESGTAHIDSYIWEYMRDRKTYYYYVTNDDWVMPQAFHTSRGKNGEFIAEDIRNEANYRLHADRMSKYVYSALLWIEHYNGWHNTFKKPDFLPFDVN